MGNFHPLDNFPGLLIDCRGLRIRYNFPFQWHLQQLSPHIHKHSNKGYLMPFAWKDSHLGGISIFQRTNIGYRFLQPHRYSLHRLRRSVHYMAIGHERIEPKRNDEQEDSFHFNQIEYCNLLMHSIKGKTGISSTLNTGTSRFRRYPSVTCMLACPMTC